MLRPSFSIDFKISKDELVSMRDLLRIKAEINKSPPSPKTPQIIRAGTIRDSGFSESEAALFHKLEQSYGCSACNLLSMH